MRIANIPRSLEWADMVETDMEVAAVGTLARRFAQLASDDARAAIAARGRWALALPGGSVAEAFLPSLIAAPIDWSRVDVFWVDERAVPTSSPDSNFGRASSAWLGDAALARRHQMHASPQELDRDADRYAATLVGRLGTPPELDLVLLGVGEDGHVASLFAGSPEWELAGRWVAAVHDAPKPPPHRLTLTPPVLVLARQVCVAAFGRTKADVLRESVRDVTSPRPLARLLRARSRTTFLLDPEAASALIA